MVESLIKKYDGNIEELDKYMNGLNLNGLVNFYLKCSNHLFFKKYNNINKILDLIYKNIFKKIDSVSLIELMDIYSNIFSETLNVEDLIESNNNIINVRKANLEDDFFIQYESNRANKSKEEFISTYIKSVDYYEENKLYLQSVFSYVDKLQQEILDYIENKVVNLSDSEKRTLLLNINEKIETNSLEIIEKNEIRRRRKTIDIQSKLGEKSTLEIFEMLDTTKLKNQNYIYNNFSAYLKKNNYDVKK